MDCNPDYPDLSVIPYPEGVEPQLPFPRAVRGCARVLKPARVELGGSGFWGKREELRTPADDLGANWVKQKKAIIFELRSRHTHTHTLKSISPHHLHPPPTHAS